MVLIHDKHVEELERFLGDIIEHHHNGSCEFELATAFRAAQLLECVQRAKRGYPNAAGKPKFAVLPGVVHDVTRG